MAKHSLTTTQSLLTTAFPQENWQFNYPLRQRTYFKIGGPAEAYLAVSDLSLLRKLTAFSYRRQIPLTVLGGASNVLIADRGVAGLVIKIENSQIELLPSEQISARAGIKMSGLVKQTLDWHLTGLEYFLGVPGTLGGAVYNNAHYLNCLLSEYIQEVTVVNQRGEVLVLSAEQCQFAYDRSRFQKSREIIWQVKMRLRAGDPAKSQALVKEATQYRARTQPLGKPSSGCVFQNVPNTAALKKRFPQFADRELISAGFLIDQAGLKGKCVGDICVSQIHAAFLVNNGQGTAKQVLQLIEIVKQKVLAKFGIQLQEEIFYLQ